MLFVDDVFSDDRVVLLNLKLTGRVSPVLRGRIEVARFRGRDESYFLTHNW